MAYTEREQAAIVFDMLLTLCAKLECENESTTDLIKERIADPYSGFSGAFKDMLYGMIHMLQNGSAFDD
jgi:hypothetical protein